MIANPDELFVYNTPSATAHDWWLQVKQMVNGDLTDFKNWEVVRGVPLYRDNEPFANEYVAENKKMMHEIPWGKEWVYHIVEPNKGHNDLSFQQAQIKFDWNGHEYSTTNWVMKCLHHILTFETMRGKSVLEYETIVEIGGGIGELARMILDRGFTGKYYIIDFPEIGKLSSYYLDNRNVLLDNIDQLEDIDTSKTLFIATWSLSETPLEYRTKFGQKLKGCDYLILFQGQFKDITNPPFFLYEWPILTDSWYRVRDMWFHQGDGGNTYMVGRGK